MYAANKAVFAAERAKQDAEIAAGIRLPRVVRVMQSPSPTEQGKGKGKAEQREVAEAKAKKEAQDKERENRFVRRDDEGLSVAVLAMVWYACAVGAFVFWICVELRGLDV
jgi:hypothetical protein